MTENSIKTFVTFDTETTGLPSQEYGKTKITEMALIATSCDMMTQTPIGVPRVMHKLTVCINPYKMIQPAATCITGLTNEMLEDEQTFNENLYDMIKLFLNRLQSPVCLVAHNGFRFDYPILQSELHKLEKTLPEDVLCVDSYTAFKDILSNIPPEMLPIYRGKYSKMNKYSNQSNFSDNTSSVGKTPKYDCQQDLSSACTDESKYSGLLQENMKLMQLANETTPPQQKSERPRPDTLQIIQAKRKLFPETDESLSALQSYKLTDIYTFLTGKCAANSHRAESDALILTECITILGHVFTNWANKHAVPFSTIKKL